MKNYSRDSRFERGKSSRKGGSRDSGRSLMHQTTCASCGSECEVPFKPTSGKPVYCSNCFEKNQNDDTGRSGRDRGGRNFPRRESGGRDFGSKSFSKPSMHNTVCDNCGIECEVPFRPTKGKPIYCDKCFENSGNKREKGTENLKKEFEIINKKLDKILKALTPVPVVEKNQQEVEEETEDQKLERKTKKTAAPKDTAKKEESAKKVTKKTAAKKVTKKTAAKKTSTSKRTKVICISHKEDCDGISSAALIRQAFMRFLSPQ